MKEGYGAWKEGCKCLQTEAQPVDVADEVRANWGWLMAMGIA